MHWMDNSYQARFFQETTELTNTWYSDHLLRSVLERLLPSDILSTVQPMMARLGDRAAGDMLTMAADAELHEPELISFGPWGRRIDEVRVAEGWKQLDRVAAEEGIVAEAYQRRFGEYSRLVQLAKLYLYSPSSAIYSCPLAMTDGAARLIEVYGDEYLRNRALVHLTSTDPEQFWTSGQWMTERTGGSDIAGSETVARPNGEGGFRLYGTKFFTSAVTSQMAMTLARIEDAKGQTIAASRGLSLFYLEVRRADGNLNEIEIHRLKDKLGTRALPTAELTLHGSLARLVGGPGHGVRKISTLFNITRIYNAVCAVSAMQRCLTLARAFAEKREAFGCTLSRLPLHLETMSEMEVEIAAAIQLVFEIGRLLGREECGTASEDETRLLRILTPLTKLYTGKQAVALASETVECFGGGGYMEDTGIPRLLRDVQTLAIWEGTTNVLSLDMLRAMHKDEALPPLLATMRRRLESVNNPRLIDARLAIDKGIVAIEHYLPLALSENEAFLEAAARSLAFSLTRLFMATLLLEQAEWSLTRSNDSRPLATALRWCSRDLATMVHPTTEHRADSAALALGRHHEIDLQ